MSIVNEFTISGNLSIGDQPTRLSVDPTGNLNIQTTGTDVITNSLLKVTNTNSSTGIGTGSAQFTGGIYIAKNIYSDGPITAYNSSSNPQLTLGTDVTKVSKFTGDTNGKLSISTYGNEINTTSDVIIKRNTTDPQLTLGFDTTNVAKFTEDATGKLSISTFGNEVNTGSILKVTNTNNSTGTGTGSVQTAGGLYVARNITDGLLTSLNSSTNPQLTLGYDSTKIAKFTEDINGKLSISTYGNEITTTSDVIINNSSANPQLTLGYNTTYNAKLTVNSNGNLDVTTVGPDVSTGSKVKVTNTEDSTGTGTGSVQTAGGLYVAKNIYSNGLLTALNTSTNPQLTLGTDVTKVSKFTGDTNGKLSISTYGNEITTTSDVIINNSSANPQLTLGYNTTYNAKLTVNSNGNLDVTTVGPDVSTGSKVKVTNTEDSTGTGTGSVQTAGGLYVAKNIYSNGLLTALNTSTNPQLTLGTDVTKVSKFTGDTNGKLSISTYGNEITTTSDVIINNSSANPQLTLGYNTTYNAKLTVNSNGNLDVTTVGPDVSTGSKVKVTNTEDSTGTGTGSVQTAGGLYVAKNIYSNGLLTALNTSTNPQLTLGTDVTKVSKFTGDTNGKLSISTYGNEITTTSDVIINNSSANPQLTLGYNTTYNAKLTVNSSGNLDVTTVGPDVSTGSIVKVTNTNDSTGPNTGSVQTAGGLYVAKNIYSNGLLTALNTSTNPQLTLGTDITKISKFTGDTNGKLSISTYGNEITTASMLKITHTDNSTGSGTGSAQFSGGIYVAKDIRSDGNIYATLNSTRVLVTRDSTGPADGHISLRRVGTATEKGEISLDSAGKIVFSSSFNEIDIYDANFLNIRAGGLPGTKLCRFGYFQAIGQTSNPSLLCCNGSSLPHIKLYNATDTNTLKISSIWCDTSGYLQIYTNISGTTGGRIILPSDVLYISNTTDSTDIDTGSVQLLGGLSVKKGLWANTINQKDAFRWECVDLWGHISPENATMYQYFTSTAGNFINKTWKFAATETGTNYCLHFNCLLPQYWRSNSNLRPIGSIMLATPETSTSADNAVSYNLDYFILPKSFTGTYGFTTVTSSALNFHGSFSAGYQGSLNFPSSTGIPTGTTVHESDLFFGRIYRVTATANNYAGDVFITGLGLYCQTEKLGGVI